MNVKNIALWVVAVSVISTLAACKPSNDPPPDIIKTQRDALNKARAVKDVTAQSAADQQKAADEQTKSEDAAAAAADKDK